MNTKRMTAFIIATGLLSACQNSSDVLLEEFQEYKQAQSLEILRQTIPQNNDEIILAFYKTAESEFGVVEFDADNYVASENPIEEITISTLEGKYGNYIGVLHSLEQLPDAREVNLYHGENELVGTFELRNNENLSVFTMEELPSQEYMIEFKDENSEVINTLDFTF